MTVTIDYQAFLLFSAIISLTAALISFIFSLVTYCKMVGLQNSTHSVQYVPMDPVTDRENEDYLKENQQEEDWATTEESYLAEDKKYRKDRNEIMPDFAVDEEEDLKIHSF